MQKKFLYRLSKGRKSEYLENLSIPSDGDKNLGGGLGCTFTFKGYNIKGKMNLKKKKKKKKKTAC